VQPKLGALGFVEIFCIFSEFLTLLSKILLQKGKIYITVYDLRENGCGFTSLAPLEVRQLRPFLLSRADVVLILGRGGNDLSCLLEGEENLRMSFSSNI